MISVKMNETIHKILLCLKNHNFDAYFTANIIVWTLILIMVLYNCICIRRHVIKKLYGKGISKEDVSMHKHKYLLQPIFSNPSKGFDLKNTKIHIEIIHEKTRLGKIDIKDDMLETTRYGCLWKDMRANIVVTRNTAMPAIHFIKGFHKSVPNSRIFFEGIECFDMKTCERIYYPIEEFLLNEEETDTKILHNVKEQRIKCFSLRTMIPSFIPLLIEDFGQQIISSDKIQKEDNNGILLSPKLHWFESIIFCSLFMNLSFLLTIGILAHMKSSKSKTSLTALFLSGFLSLLITELLAIIYKDFIKRNYYKNCCPMRIKSGTASRKWSFILYFYMFFVFLLSLLASVLISIDRKGNNSIANKYGFNLFKNKPKLNELIFILLFLSASLLLSSTVWLTLFSIVRFGFRKFSRKVRLETDVESEPPKGRELKNKDERKSEPQKRQFTRERDEKKKSPKEKKVKTIDSEESEPKIDFSTEKLEKQLKDQRKRLTTNTIIAEPTKSQGFISPEEFRLTESKTDAKEQNKEN